MAREEKWRDESVRIVNQFIRQQINNQYLVFSMKASVIAKWYAWSKRDIIS